VPPDPQDAATFQSAKLNHHLRQQGQHGVLRAYYKELIRLRRTLPALAQLRKDCMEVVSFEEPRLLYVRRWSPDDASATMMICHFGSLPTTASVPLPRDLAQVPGLGGPEWHGPGQCGAHDAPRGGGAADFAAMGGLTVCPGVKRAGQRSCLNTTMARPSISPWARAVHASLIWSSV
jgi:hypothetical protein